MDVTKKYIIKKYQNEEVDEVEDLVVCEYPLTIFLNDQEFITLLCSPKSLKNLSIGFLYSEGIIKSASDIDSINIDEKMGYAYIKIGNVSKFAKQLYGKRVITTGCGKGSIFYNALDSLKCKQFKNNLDMDYKKLLDIMKLFNKKSELFLETGGVHSVGLIDGDDILYFEEDIGRHNALDKIIGSCLIDNVNIEDKAIITSGRITSEIVLKCAKLGIGCIISRSAPTNLAIDTGKKLNIEIIGFARGNKLNVYNKNN
ncbi:formate dehydrogenase accessory sulfurtransferase FdhD [Paraclostridium bifermentans]|uniref:formate dehydrogenase accessory sulfurtransferase FdhD n=1 Tax=Paraclostridium TaxID=1849822 RepID=UPI00038CA6AF|nr:formate dehydrogenase accessory sulfurtransferase FdhD [Paraclostridium bifermentans]EQK39871.1 formate dehydrogenase family accessory protein FdhD [[Clostridium] bifermentans ATCC 19299] [Paraclostridium bifermentans ATCC 19299]MCR1874959.1 formate dehydrogenase accessory sulfurtransferase FdhD [Paraclostridium bifermentans]TQO57955.1 formate dehydrogenase accessory sulfurtransferase FdhD [Paraclostridium bifermentans]GKZ01750.1 sulfurtransferase FdhD [Paraclostridium bifermentans]GKZ07677